MRNTEASSNTALSVWFRALAEARARPKGFSRMTRAPLAHPERPRPSTTVGNMLGGRGGAERLAQRGVGLGLAVVGVDVAEPLHELGEGGLVHGAVVGDALA